MTNKKEAIYKLNLHEEIDISASTRITRVPGGWIYHRFSMSSLATSTFVPFNNEFQETNPDNLPRYDEKLGYTFQKEDDETH